ncbi:hypothetical protein H9Q69_009839 [Fusarium xylarioides]|nr:hypothetical protein H9Q70_005622 [Fusarium xylarioides]KAG5791115.1 hypothetical protein H9Q69_009839 [Fusarium xylarioides]
MQDLVVSIATNVFGLIRGGEAARFINGQQPFKTEEEQSRTTTLLSGRLLSEGGKLFDHEEYTALLFDSSPTGSSLSRPQVLLKLCAVELGTSALHQCFVDKGREALPEVDVSIFNWAVWSTVLNLKPELDQAAVSRAVMKDRIIRSMTLEAFNCCILRLPTTGMYNYYLSDHCISDEDPKPWLMVNGVLITTTKDTSSSFYIFGSTSLQGGEEVHHISREFVGILTLDRKFNFTKQELESFAATQCDSKSTLGIRNRHVMRLEALYANAKLRDSTHVKTFPLVGLLAWLQTPDEDKDTADPSLGYAVGAIFLNVPGNWRYILGSSLLFSTIMFFGMLFLPESPRFLIHQKRHLDAYKVWKRIRGIEDRESREEFYVMSASVISEQNAVAEGAKNHRFPWMDFFTEPRARRALVYANIMILLGQLTGVNAIMYYMSVLINQIGFDKKESNYMSLVGGGSLLLGTIPAIFLMERFGRRFWAITMLPGFFIGLVLIGVSYQFDVKTQLQTVEGLYLSGLIIYMGFFGSYACLTWVVPSEVYPTYLRSYGMTTSDALLFLASFVVTYNFTAMQNAMGRTGLALGFYGGIAFIGEIYQIFFMPETKNKTLEEIDVVFSRPTMDIVRENWAGVKETTHLLLTGHWHKVFVEQAMTDPKDQVEVSHA